MTPPASRLRQIGWLALLAVCLALFVALTFRVNAVKSEVVRAEKKIVSLERETRRLETEYQTRANQQQLATWNKVDFGYGTPRADQFMETERQLAELGEGRAPGAPAPIRVARAPKEGADDGGDQSPLIAMVSPLTGLPATAPAASPDQGASREEMSASTIDAQAAASEAAASLADRLGAPMELSSAQTDLAE